MEGTIKVERSAKRSVAQFFRREGLLCRELAKSTRDAKAAQILEQEAARYLSVAADIDPSVATAQNDNEIETPPI